MEFKVKKKVNPNVKHYRKEDLDLAYDFAKKVYKEFGSFLKAVVLFGSLANEDIKRPEQVALSSDIPRKGL